MLTIITITKNDLQGIQRNLQSTIMLRQFCNVKQIIIDSSDQEIYQQLIQKTTNENNLEIYHQAPQGISKAFNYGIELAEDAWLWFLNGGDEVHPELDIDLFIKILETSVSDLMIFPIEVFNIENNQLLYNTRLPSLLDLWPPIYNWVTHPGNLIQKKCIVNCGKFKEEFKIAMDADLWFRLFFKNYTTDLLSIKIARFYAGGVSSNEEETYKEMDLVIKIYFLSIVKISFKKMIDVLKVWLFYKKYSILPKLKQKFPFLRSIKNLLINKIKLPVNK
ncbi:glycosyltransferase [Pseudanabaena sp. FACHB-1998]|uniref:glycosyltransferase n=1 Tax=Pseudanabaena sp. FACHB-1998 TaxID=2692858 RepID=UPI0016814B4F|nr:glycosyltransferase [Pseudanabaena sp. FACHB-1998]MBD2178835.1 glycosyltransferase [Pseudanabaena sp. FACHB-1998]